MKTLRWVYAERKKLSTAQRRTVYIAHHGVCHICGGEIHAKVEGWQVNEVAEIEAEDAPDEDSPEFEDFEAEHVRALGLGGSDDVKDLRPAHVKCHKAKTRRDRQMMAWADKRKDSDMGAKVPKQKIRSRGFPKKSDYEWKRPSYWA